VASGDIGIVGSGVRNINSYNVLPDLPSSQGIGSYLRGQSSTKPRYISQAAKVDQDKLRIIQRNSPVNRQQYYLNSVDIYNNRRKMGRGSELPANSGLGVVALKGNLGSSKSVAQLLNKQAENY